MAVGDHQPHQVPAGSLPCALTTTIPLPERSEQGQEFLGAQHKPYPHSWH